MPPTDEHALLLGEIKAKTELTYNAVQEIQKDVGDMKTRMTKLETHAGTYGGIAGAVFGAVFGMGVSLVVAKLERTLGI